MFKEHVSELSKFDTYKQIKTQKLKQNQNKKTKSKCNLFQHNTWKARYGCFQRPNSSPSEQITFKFYDQDNLKVPGHESP